jgi:SNF2 family DNA or RNA helicase
MRHLKAGDNPLFLISLKAGGTGLNLTEADTVIHLDPWWNPAVEDQASDRVYRMGQKNPVTVYRLVATETIEEKIIQLHHDKRDLADKVLAGQNQAQQLSPSVLLELMKA